ncbi:hypothetical protein [Granulicella tundricola]|uniref:Uncharacterized protein n=1 Tax=Granulicella tundricola (strain ATCC BAA-1859 / DSM 23138 / MP5ACTX9) TaxID=1198114 RepID=E8X0F7_GRATM|nr:hypothetical protein [Granulicella tundricola]ADW67821.1 hypothetical protein AciX9_0751 [Granulicella tundricola MP5ACTX9]
MTTPDSLDTDVIQDRILRLQASLESGDLKLEQVYKDLIAISQEMLFVAEDLESRRINSIVPGANVTF